eukprot:CAMPEP_0184331296 /NCGR_PEP_ID=MMETSP1089-20130417/620_1 /TAXON_ID=38269 ORGANISM="Gloeochaete wittrockiana, Strain SAG46.84" /NCGR_SAMPLE_ID=MMETSP1089 /ASSEMBLY_ACC=CAM_ASM_000445 /LENGTH=170 /DNA_ID=CAMNT_0026654119 /DNA_START=36 /DNA_END=548 /DNA_ORIENTATION=+
MAAAPVPAATKRQFQAARTEFKELSIGELKEFELMFALYDTSQDGFLDLMELKYLMEKIGHPQTHLGLKAMIREIDEDNDGLVAYREFLLIFRFAKTGRLVHDGLKAIAGSINVADVGVGGARGFFEAKASALNDSPAEKDRAYREEKKREADAKRAAKSAFKDRLAGFQ